MHAVLSDDVIDSLRFAARKLTGFERRQFQAEMAVKYCGGSARSAERVFGWGRAAVQTGLHEKRTGIRCLDNFQQRGRKKSEVVDPQLEVDIREIVEPLTQSDPKFQTPLAFTRATASTVRKALTEKYRQTGQKVPARRTLIDILNRIGYRLKRVRKTRPEKKSPKPTPSSKTSTQPTIGPRQTRKP
jgi:transposase